MNSHSAAHTQRRRRIAALTAILLLTASLLAAVAWPRLGQAVTGRLTPDPVTGAWEKARAAGSYHFTSDVVQKSIPVASLTNVGRSSRSEALYLEGQNDLRSQTMELTLWSQGGSALNADSGVSVRTADGKTFTRRGNEVWQESDSFVDGFAPQGDFLGYLAAIRHVTADETETRGGITFTRYTFTIDGPAFANYMHEQMLTALRAKGELPPGIELEPPAYYRDMIGSGELWVGENGLPVRQILDLCFPQQKDERVEAAITVNFSNYGAEQTGLLSLLRGGDWQGMWLVLPSRLPDFTGVWLLFSLGVASFLIVRYRRVRPVQVALVTAVIFSQVVGPLLSVVTQTRFFDSYQAKAATQEAKQAVADQERDLRTAVQTGPQFDPHQNPLETGRQEDQKTGRQEDWESVTQSPTLSIAQSPSLQTVDPGTDTDGDTLTDFTEVRIDTSEVISDTDDDGLNDNLEVNGFSMGGQTWYTDPNAQDSNRDSLADVLEWGVDTAGDLRTAPFDTDGDSLPDLFDPDNDNDGVADRQDLAPFVKGAATYSAATPLELTVNNLTPDKPTFVEFQIRPQDPKNLWFAHNVLDWPQDSEGQVRDVDGKTYADFALAQGRAADAVADNGDMKAIPMLEIRIPTAPSGPPANLPSQAELTPFNISVNDFTSDGATKVAYVPLSVITDEQSGERVAFSGQMRYKPRLEGNRSWTTPHSVRLAWLVQALNDLPCDPKNTDDVAKGCQSDGYIHNQPTMLHGYYDNWTLTGLTVREDHGTSMGIVYEDPVVDNNKKEDAGIWALSMVLDHHFLLGRDENNDSVRDLKVSNLPARFDRDNNPSEAQRFAVPLAVFTESSAVFGYVGPNDRLYYTSTVVASVPVEPGILEVTVPANQNVTPAPVVLPFNTLTFSGSQTVTQAINFTALPSGALATIDLLSTARTRLQRSTGSPWVADPVVTGAPLGGFTAPLSARSSALTAARPDRPDSYLLSSVTLNNTNSLFGEVRGYNLNTGANTVLANSALVNNSSYFPRSSAGMALAANALGTNLAVWDHRDYCRTLTINSLRVVAAASDTNGGIEPFITIDTNDRATSEQVWYWDAAGGTPDMTPGQQRGPNAGGFPITRTLCGATDLKVFESDGPVNIPAQNELVASNEILVGSTYDNFNLLFDGFSHRVDLNITILPQEDLFTVGGALLNSDGAVQASLSFPRPAISATAQLNMFNPVVASDGDGFVALYEATIERLTGRPTQRYLVAQAFDRNGVAAANSFRLLATPDFASNFPNTVYDLDWIGDRYRVVWKAKDGATVSLGDIDRNGVFLGTGWTTLVTDASTSQANLSEMPYTPQLAANPRSEQWLLTYNRGVDGMGVALLYPTRTSTVASVSREFVFSLQSVAAYNPSNRGWVVGWYAIPHLLAYPLNLLDLSDVAPLQFGSPPFVLESGSSYASSALACPLPQALPAAEFRLEELPTSGATLTSFSDSAAPSGLPGNTATCSSTECPTPGASGAPNAPLSDYAAQFDGVDDRLIFANANAAVFSVALWLKAAPNANTDAYLFRNNNIANTGWNVGLKNGIPQLALPGLAPLAGSARIDDNNWHHVAASFSFVTGATALYVDGVQVASRTAGLSSISIGNTYAIGAANNGSNAFKGTLDHVQLYVTDLAASTVAALYNRTLQPYCVASGAGSNGADIHWGKLTLRENDLRGGRLTATGGLKVVVDNQAPTAAVTSLQGGAIVAPDTVIGGTASDTSSAGGGIGVGKVEISINNGAWQLAAGANSWSFSLAGLSGAVNIRARATDLVGNVGAPSAAVNVTVDNTPPALTINAGAATLKPTKNAAGQWQVPLGGTASDSSGVQNGSLLVELTQASDIGVAQTQQAATINGNNWSINYLLDPGLYDPTGNYTVTAQVDDSVGNRTVAAPQVIRLDASGPVVDLNVNDATRTFITQTLTIGGVISDSNSIVGIDKLEIAFTPIEQIASLPGNITSSEAEAILNRQWLPVTLAQRGAGVAQTTWSVAIPTDLENEYQIDLRGYDLLGNVSISAGLWRGTIDTRNPRLVMTATATGATYVNTADNTQRYEVRFVCGVQDRNLNEASFVCPGEGLAEPIRSFDSNPALQALFPDLTLRTGLAISYTLWTTSTTPAATARVCDTFGRCAGTSAGSVAGTSAGSVATVAELVEAAAAAPGAPVAVIVNPTHNSFVAAGNAISVTVAAEAGAGVKEVTIKLDNAIVQTLSFAQSPAITRTVRTINVPVATEGPHTLVAQATAWDNASQTTLFPVVFTLDKTAPTLTIDASALTLADTWQAQSGVLRFNGNASDSVGLAAVQIREGNNGFTDATFSGGSGNGTWRVALPVADPEGRTLNITVRAIDRAGRTTQLNQAIATDLSAADAPDTTISSGPANPSSVNTVQFVFTGSATAVAFECQIDNAPYAPCGSPTNYADLSKGSHTYRVRAIDGRGLPDLSPAEYAWTVNAGQPDATITGKPTHPTTERTATFTFNGDATATSFKCSLDGNAYATCTSPQVYNNLGNGEHTFLVRARNSANVAGAADRYTWTVNNLAPVANSQTVLVLPNQAKSITLTATDNEALLYTIVTPPTHGVLSGLAPNVTYSPDTNYGGTDSFTFKVSDGLAESNVATVTIFVDNVPPVVTCSVTPNNLWPPNHKMVSIQATVMVTDVHSGPAGFRLVSVTSNEPDSGVENGDVSIDIQNWVAGTPDVVGLLRAERSGTGNGRLYTLLYEGKDLAGNKALCTTTVTVPKNQGGLAAATYDETQVFEDAFTEELTAPTVTPPVEETVIDESEQTGGAEQTIQLFLPLINQDAIVE